MTDTPTELRKKWKLIDIRKRLQDRGPCISDYDLFDEADAEIERLRDDADGRRSQERNAAYEADIAQLEAEIERLRIERDEWKACAEIEVPERQRLTHLTLDQTAEIERLRTNEDSAIKYGCAMDEVNDELRIEIEQLQEHSRLRAHDIITLGQEVGRLEAEIERLRAEPAHCITCGYRNELDDEIKRLQALLRACRNHIDPTAHYRLTMAMDAALGYPTIIPTSAAQ